MPKPRHLLLAATVWLVLASQAQAQAPAQSQAPSGNTDGARMRRSSANPFAAHSWTPPPPKAQPVVVVQPKAPPLPFLYLGKMQDGNAVTAFVSLGGQIHLLHGGDTLRDYRVEAISAKEISFVYLPLNEKQRLSIRNDAEK